MLNIHTEYFKHIAPDSMQAFCAVHYAAVESAHSLMDQAEQRLNEKAYSEAVPLLASAVAELRLYQRALDGFFAEHAAMGIAIDYVCGHSEPKQRPSDIFAVNRAIFEGTEHDQLAVSHPAYTLYPHGAVEGYAWEQVTLMQGLSVVYPLHWGWALWVKALLLSGDTDAADAQAQTLSASLLQYRALLMSVSETAYSAFFHQRGMEAALMDLAIVLLEGNKPLAAIRLQRFVLGHIHRLVYKPLRQESEPQTIEAVLSCIHGDKQEAPATPFDAYVGLRRERFGETLVGDIQALYRSAIMALAGSYAVFDKRYVDRAQRLLVFADQLDIKGSYHYPQSYEGLAQRIDIYRAVERFTESIDLTQVLIGRLQSSDLYYKLQYPGSSEEDEFTQWELCNRHRAALLSVENEEAFRIRLLLAGDLVGVGRFEEAIEQCDWVVDSYRTRAHFSQWFLKAASLKLDYCCRLEDWSTVQRLSEMLTAVYALLEINEPAHLAESVRYGYFAALASYQQDELDHAKRQLAACHHRYGQLNSRLKSMIKADAERITELIGLPSLAVTSIET